MFQEPKVRPEEVVDNWYKALNNRKVDPRVSQSFKAGLAEGAGLNTLSIPVVVRVDQGFVEDDELKQYSFGNPNEIYIIILYP